MARPPANPEGRRSIRRGVPLTPSEDAAIVEAAGDRPVAEWLREMVEAAPEMTEGAWIDEPPPYTVADEDDGTP